MSVQMTQERRGIFSVPIVATPSRLCKNPSICFHPATRSLRSFTCRKRLMVLAAIFAP